MANIETVNVNGSTCNVFVVDSTWKIDHFLPEKNYAVDLVLPYDIEW